MVALGGGGGGGEGRCEKWLRALPFADCGYYYCSMCRMESGLGAIPLRGYGGAVREAAAAAAAAEGECEGGMYSRCK